MDDRYPATDDHQSVHLEYSYPDDPNRWLPLIKWLLAGTGGYRRAARGRLTAAPTRTAAMSAIPHSVR
jgi:hypothetical protein